MVVDPLRSRPPPLCRRGLRDDATEGDLLGALREAGTSSSPSQPDEYRNDHSKMVVQLAQPCPAVYRRRPQRESQHECGNMNAAT